ncbi:MAG: hypothetical protein K6G54_06115 [Oscillospiraceae bacterium]|nr:hypothetical protein [Oscillospiraceae bacterium]
MKPVPFFYPSRDALDRADKLTEPEIASANNTVFSEGGLLMAQLGMQLSVKMEMSGTGLSVSSDKVPETNGVPRLFLFKDGKISSLQESGIQVGTKDFWASAVKGQLFAYPAGAAHPVQLLMEAKGGGRTPSVSVSEPLDPNRLPALPAYQPEQLPRKPRWYHRLFKFGSNRALCDRYDAAVRDSAQKEAAWNQKNRETGEAMRAAAQGIRDAYGARRDEDSLDTERTEQETMLRNYRQKAELQTLREQREQLSSHIEDADRGVKNCMSFYQPTPKLNTAWLRKDGGDRICTEESFQTLKPLDGEAIHNVKIGGEGVSDLEFTALALYAAHDPAIGIEAQKVSADPAPIVDALKAAGFQEGEAKEYISKSVSEPYTRSLMRQTPRGDSDRYFESAVQPGREAAFAALQAYQNGDKKPLADILARTVAEAGDTSRYSAFLDSDFFASNRVALAAVNLMERDKDLAKLAEKTYQEKENAFRRNHPDIPANPSFSAQLSSIRQLDRMDRLLEDANRSKLALLDAQLNQTRMNGREKKTHLRTILKANFVAEDYKNAGEAAEKSKDYQSLTSRALDITPLKQSGLGSKGGSSIPVAPGTILLTGLQERYHPKPKILGVLGSEKATAQLDEAIDDLIDRDRLLYESSSVLSEKLFGQNKDYTEKLPEKLHKQTQSQMQNAAPAPDRTLRNNRSPEEAVLQGP